MNRADWEMIQFENPEWMHLFWALPVLFVVFMLSRYLYNRSLKQFGRADIILQMADMQSRTRPYVKFILIVFSFSFLSLAMVNPRVGSRMEEARLEGTDIVIALDVSRSMQAGDVRPNRLERARLAVSRLIENLDNDRIAIVVFAGTAHTQVPLTADHHAARMVLRTLGPESVSAQGTAVGRAIARASLAFVDEERANKTIILLSDGESHEDDPVQYARIAGEKGITIHTAGIGSREGAPIPVYENGNVADHLRDSDGRVIITRYDEETMRRIAEETGGIFRHGSGPDLGLDSILEEIRALEKEAYQTSIFAEYESRFHYMAALALVLLLMETLIMDRKNRYLRNVRLFKTS